jgi:hypothetical protein
MSCADARRCAFCLFFFCFCLCACLPTLSLFANGRTLPRFYFGWCGLRPDIAATNEGKLQSVLYSADFVFSFRSPSFIVFSALKRWNHLTLPGSVLTEVVLLSFSQPFPLPSPLSPSRAAGLNFISTSGLCVLMQDGHATEEVEGELEREGDKGNPSSLRDVTTRLLLLFFLCHIYSPVRT